MTARAEEPLPIGTTITRPGLPTVTLTDTRWIITRPEVERIIVKDADLEACRKAVKACEGRTAAAPVANTSTFVAVALGVAAVAFVGGVYAGSRIR